MTRHLGGPDPDQPLPIYDAAVRYQEEGVPLVVLGGKEYGSGSSRDWAAKGTRLLGVRAVIAESFERIHRSNLVGMGVLPLQFPEGESAGSLGLTGEEEITITGLADALNAGELPRTVQVQAGDVAFDARVRIDTPKEADYFRHGGHPPLRPAPPRRGGGVTDVLIVGDTLRSPELRHELPIAIGDPFLYAEHDGRRIVLTNVLEADRLAAAAPDVERLLGEELGRGELIAQGLPRHEVELEVLARAVERVGVRSALVPPGFPVAVADLLRARGVELDGRPRGVRPAPPPQDRGRARRDPPGHRGRAGVARRGGPRPARGAPARRRPGVGGRGLTSERLRARLAELCARLGATLPPDVIVATMGPGDAIGHESGSGPLKPDTPICFDLWPQDDASGCWTDMTRTFVVGEVSDAVGDLHRLVREAHERSLEQLRAGAVAEASYDAACDVFEAAGHPTQRTARPGEPLTHGFYFSLGHGVGLEVHEAPLLEPQGRDGARRRRRAGGRAGARRPGPGRDARGGPRARRRRRRREPHRRRAGRPAPLARRGEPRPGRRASAVSRRPPARA